MHVRIAGTGSYLPEHVMSNDELAQKVDTNDEWIRERTGIHQRHLAAAHESASFMGAEAARAAIAAAGLQAQDIDLVIVATMTPDKVFPSTACLVQKALNIPACAAYDLTAACSGFIYALVAAKQAIEVGSARHAVIIGSEVMSRVLDWQERSTCVLFGDGAGAMVLSASDTAGVRSTHLYADGQFDELLYTNGWQSQDDRLDPFLRMRGNEVFRHAVKAMGGLVEEVLQANQISKQDIDWLIPHQANIRIIEAMAKKLNMPMQRVIMTIAQHANTSAASLPLALDHGIRHNQVKRGDTLLLEAFGGGFTWGAALITY